MPADGLLNNCAYYYVATCLRHLYVLPTNITSCHHWNGFYVANLTKSFAQIGFFGKTKPGKVYKVLRSIAVQRRF